MNIAQRYRRILIPNMTDELEQYLHQGYQIEEIVKPHKEKAEDIIDLVREYFLEAGVDIGQYRSIFYKYMKKLTRETRGN